MLVLTRKKNESILIGEDILVTVLNFQRGDSGRLIVKLGFTLPKKIQVQRTENLRGTLLGDAITLTLPGQLTC